MNEDQLESLHDAVTILRRMLSSLDRNTGRLEVLIAAQADPSLVEISSSWQEYTLSVIGNVGLAISAISDNDTERLNLVTSMFNEWKDTPNG